MTTFATTQELRNVYFRVNFILEGAIAFGVQSSYLRDQCREARDLLRTACETMETHGVREEDEAYSLAFFDSLSLVTDALASPITDFKLLAMAKLALEPLRAL